MEKFIDEIYLSVRSGSGGNGAVSFERMKFKPKGKPDGGDGGRGGNVILKTVPGLSELSHLKKISLIKAKNGNNGGNSRKKGREGEDVFIRLPAGVVIKDFNTKEVITELVKIQDEYIIARGGEGGRGNSHFKSAANRSPRQKEDGKPGIEKKIIIELKLLADIGFVGFPNVGKSTLLDSLTDARPRVDSYPFTTLTPNLGIFYDEYTNPYTIADVPGIVEDAHKGKGLGIQFLKHIERTKVLCLIVDISQKDFEDKKEKLLSELKEYDTELANKKIILAGNKIDLADNDDLIKKAGKDYILISALKSTNLERIKKIFIKAVKEAG